MFQKARSFFTGGRSSSASFQVLSDLHLEISQLYSSYEIPVCADHLILAGDTGRFIDYGDYYKPFQNSVLVLGNHEFYEGTQAERLEKAKQLEQEPSEMKLIREENEKTEDKSQKRSILVVTHHAPLMKKPSSPQHAKNPWRVAFGTDTIPQISDGIKTWVFGHTHYTTDFKEGCVRVVSNKRGYVLPWSDPKTQDKFDVRKVIHV
ncbi:calcineurin-like phosphoesterase [Penicillium malachiteum]|nr:calcineurin-like phosphoesterase [Penicillium malachiteum]